MTTPLDDNGINDRLAKLRHSSVRRVLSSFMSDILEQ